MTIDAEFFRKSGQGPPPTAFPVFETSTSQLVVWGRCDRRFYYRYVRGLVPITTNDNLQWGTLWHKGIQAYYEGIKNRKREDAAMRDAQTIVESCKLVQNRFHGDTQISLDEKQRETLWDTMTYYYNQVACLDNWDEILAVEDNVYLVVGYQGQPVMQIRSTFDLVAKKDGKLCIVDHKTTGEVQKSLEFLELDVQMRSYILSGATFYDTDPMLCYNMIARDVPPGYGHRPLTTPTGRTRSVETLSAMQNPANYLHREWKTYTDKQLNAIHRQFVQMALMIQFEGQSGIWPRKVVTAGGMACDSCPYFAICTAEQEKMVEDHSPLISLAFTHDPLIVVEQPSSQKIVTTGWQK